MELGIAGRVAMVAAGSKGIGLAVAKGLAEAGCRVSICARGAEALEEARRSLCGIVGEADVLAFAADVSQTSDLDAWVAATTARFGCVDILVTNTGGPPAADFMHLTDDQWEAGVQGTLMNVVRLSRAVIPGMASAGWGRIIHITSLVARQPIADLTISSTLRAGISALTRTMARQVAGDGILVNAVLPGNTLTDRATHLARVRSAAQGITLEEALDQTGKAAPVGRYARPDEIADAVVFLSSERASYITGVSLLVDGGLTQGVG